MADEEEIAVMAKPTGSVRINPTMGYVLANFSKPDQRGSEFTNLLVIVGDTLEAVRFKSPFVAPIQTKPIQSFSSA
jgi:hypothetical protein